MHSTAFRETAPGIVKRMAMTVAKECMGIKQGESVLVVADTIRKDLGMPIYAAVLELAVDAVYMEMKPRKVSGEEPPRMVADAMYDADAIIAVTSVSLTHTQAKMNAVRHGARIATMPFGSKSTEFVMKTFTTGGMTADFKKMGDNIHRLAERLGGTKRARITTEKGTDLTIDYEGRRFYEDTGMARRPGDFTNLPAGELYVAPVNANGIVAVDMTMGRLGKLMSPITLSIKDGYTDSVKGERADELEKILGAYGPEAWNVAELGIGMNPRAHVCGLLIEDEKMWGTVHIALGSDSDFGGDVSAGIHIDGVIGHPEIYADGEKLALNDYI